MRKTFGALHGLIRRAFGQGHIVAILLLAAAIIGIAPQQAHAQTSVLYWTESTDTNRLNLTVQKVGNRYLVNNSIPAIPRSRKAYFFVDWDMLGTYSSPGVITNLDLEPAQMHLIHVYEVASGYTVNDFWNANAGRSAVVAFLWIGGAPQSQTNMSAQL